MENIIGSVFIVFDKKFKHSWFAYHYKEQYRSHNLNEILKSSNRDLFADSGHLLCLYELNHGGLATIPVLYISNNLLFFDISSQRCKHTINQPGSLIVDEINLELEQREQA